VTIFLLDENVLRELRPGGNARVRAWFAGVPADCVRISAMTLFEKRRGVEVLRNSDPDRARALGTQIDVLEASYGTAIIPVDGAVAAEWAKLLGAKEKNQRDRALAATARVHGFVLVTRNISHVAGCEVDVLDPFCTAPRVIRV
jgi:predicted nucleic acid-binding protein